MADGIIYSLAGAHANYLTIVPSVLDPLMVKYPDSPLRRVELFHRETDTSLAFFEDDTMRLNAYWFASDPEFLQNASRAGRGWHCCLGQEPQRVLTHEFGHSLMMVRRALKDWATRKWLEATTKPWLAPSGYALVSDEEYFPETFAALELRALAAGMQRELYDLLADRSGR